jgi:hypothetical protein
VLEEESRSNSEEAENRLSVSLSLVLPFFHSFGGRKEGIWVDSEDLGDAWVGILLIKEHIPSNFG